MVDAIQYEYNNKNLKQPPILTKDANQFSSKKNSKSTNGKDTNFGNNLNTTKTKADKFVKFFVLLLDLYFV